MLIALVLAVVGLASTPEGGAPTASTRVSEASHHSSAHAIA